MAQVRQTPVLFSIHEHFWTGQVQEFTRLLLVDADLPLRKPLIEMLKQEYSVIVANTADRGLELAGQELQPQLALINASLNHRGDGIELCQRIRRLPNGDDLGILLISDTSSDEEYQQGLAAGVIDFIQQPISHTLLRALLSRQIHQREKS